MIRNLKALGLGLVVVFAMGAVAVSAAGAAEFEFHSDGDWTTFLGSQEGAGVFKFDAGEVTCKKVTYSGATSTTATPEIELEPEYGECSSALGTVTIDRNGCKYIYMQEKKTMPGPDYDTTDYLSCPKVGGVTQELTLTFFTGATLKCTIHIPEQDVGTTSVWTSSSGKYKLKLAIRQYVYTQTAGTGLGKCATAAGTTNGTYDGEATIEGRNTAGGSTEIWIE